MFDQVVLLPRWSQFIGFELRSLVIENALFVSLPLPPPSLDLLVFEACLPVTLDGVLVNLGDFVPHPLP